MRSAVANKNFIKYEVLLRNIAAADVAYVYVCSFATHQLDVCLYRVLKITFTVTAVGYYVLLRLLNKLILIPYPVVGFPFNYDYFVYILSKSLYLFQVYFNLFIFRKKTRKIIGRDCV